MGVMWDSILAGGVTDSRSRGIQVISSLVSVMCVIQYVQPSL